MVFRISLLVMLIFLAAAAISVSSEDKTTYVVQMDKAMMRALENSLGESKKWYEAVMDSITELSAEQEGGGGGGGGAVPPELLYSYETAITGFAAKLSTKQLESLKNNVEGFLSAVPDELLSLQTTHSPQFLGLKLGRGLLSRQNSANDVIIGFIDSGIWPEHPSGTAGDDGFEGGGGGLEGGGTGAIGGDGGGDGGGAFGGGGGGDEGGGAGGDAGGGGGGDAGGGEGGEEGGGALDGGGGADAGGGCGADVEAINLL